ncbi:MAG: sigma-70 family RNA polymerase sigma factor [Planctomycetes bacterium]|nr:sigma-70 family RNA polymerase sigma factor [Planctomycetota bacterium]MBL7146065.1 sigma-70 family RNA polymerase sigma factor [Phycisphaerae bacterium]
MLEDKLLVWKFKRGSADALRRIYEKYKNDLLALAIALSRDRTTAEDVLHDVFVSFAQYADKLQLRISLKSYLSSCIANRVRNMNRAKSQRTMQLNHTGNIGSDCDGPQRLAISAEQSERIEMALSELPYQQREVIILHFQSGMRFKAIAESQGVSINTIQSRYRYGLDKLRSLLNSEVEK